MVLSEKYEKTIINDKIYDTVLLADVMELNNEKYFIVSGYLFNNKKIDNPERVDSTHIKDTFFKRSEEENADIDAYYLIYNMDKKETIKNKKQFIEENNLSKVLKLDRTKCEQVEIGKDIGYKINTNTEEYIFMEMQDESTPYLLMKNDKNGLFAENMITFNEQKNKADITNGFKYIEEKTKEMERINIFKLANDTNTFFKKIVLNNEAKEEV